jgi:hypothetical protein
MRCHASPTRWGARWGGGQGVGWGGGRGSRPRTRPRAGRLAHAPFVCDSPTTTPYRQVDSVKAKALETILILHMDHEQNASTSTVRTAGSSQANPFACVASGIAALWGPAHGGANEAVLKMLAVGAVRGPGFRGLMLTGVRFGGVRRQRAGCMGAGRPWPHPTAWLLLRLADPQPQTTGPSKPSPLPSACPRRCPPPPPTAPAPCPAAPPPRPPQAIGTKDRIPEFVARAKDRNDPFRLMGFGHRVYKVWGRGRGGEGAGGPVAAAAAHSGAGRGRVPGVRPPRAQGAGRGPGRAGSRVWGVHGRFPAAALGPCAHAWLRPNPKQLRRGPAPDPPIRVNFTHTCAPHTQL